MPKANPWGPARLDAVGMIFNRLTGLDLGPPPSFLIPDNIKVADAPVRYPFLWNAPMQDKTQWPGFADNGSDILALARNLGEVYRRVRRVRAEEGGLLVNFLNNNSANFDGLGRIEDLLKQLGPPRWPWLVDTSARGPGEGDLRPADRAGRLRRLPWDPAGQGPLPARCRPGRRRSRMSGPTPASTTSWPGPPRPGCCEGAFIPFVTRPLEETDLAFNILSTSVVGSIVEHVLSGGGIPTAAAQVAQSEADKREAIQDKLDAAAGNRAARQRFDATRQRLDACGILGRKRGPQPLPPALRDLEGAFRVPQNLQPQASPRLGAEAGPPTGAYESRVMQGIWATAPVPAQRLGADARRAAQAGRAAREVVQDRQRPTTP